MRDTVVSLIVLERAGHCNGFFTAAGQEIDADRPAKLATAHSRSRLYYVIVLLRLVLLSLAVRPQFNISRSVCAARSAVKVTDRAFLWRRLTLRITVTSLLLRFGPAWTSSVSRSFLQNTVWNGNRYYFLCSPAVKLHERNLL